MSKQHISLAVATAVGLGAIIGAGIFVLSGTAIALAGSLSLAVFVVVGVISILIAFHIAELASLMPRLKGASYSYAYEAFGSELGFITGIIFYFGYATAISVVALGFGSYASSLIGLSSIYSRAIGIILILVLALLNTYGINRAARVDSVLVYIKISILIIFSIFAIYISLTKGFFHLSNFSITASNLSIVSLFSAAVAVFFAYTGFQVIATFISNIEGGPRIGAKAIILSVTISTIIYCLVALSLIMIVPANRFSISVDPLSFALHYVNAPQYILILIDIGALIATASTTLALIISSSRVLYQISADHLLPKIFRRYDKNKDVPINAVIVSAIIGIIMLLSGNIFVISAISDFGFLFSYITSVFAVVHFRRVRRELYSNEMFKVPFYPYSSIVTAIAILAFMLGMPREALDIGVILIIVLLLTYYTLKEMERKKVIRVRLFK
ncbi:MAG: amino acid transporter [Candidatus Micrarchaeota archaeon]|nr:MAG: amino acid transporter [Candidatus Micrarchaeota archaeon]